MKKLLAIALIGFAFTVAAETAMRRRTVTPYAWSLFGPTVPNFFDAGVLSGAATPTSTDYDFAKTTCSAHLAIANTPQSIVATVGDTATKTINGITSSSGWRTKSLDVFYIMADGGNVSIGSCAGAVLPVYSQFSDGGQPPYWTIPRVYGSSAAGVAATGQNALPNYFINPAFMNVNMLSYDVSDWPAGNYCFVPSQTLGGNCTINGTNGSSLTIRRTLEAISP